MTEINQEHWHPEAFVQNRWTTVYRRLIMSGLGRQKQTGYENHHIIPESFFVNRSRTGPPGWLPGNPDVETNLVWLSWREHRLAHRLLSRISLPQGITGMRTAEWLMIHDFDSDGRPYRISSRQYERLREEWSDQISDFITKVWQRPEYRQLQRDIQPAIQRSMWASRPDLKESHRNTALAQRQDPEYIVRHRDGLLDWAKDKMDNDPSFLENSMTQLVKAQEARRDKTVYRWTHRDGTVFVGTRGEFCRTHDIKDIKQLFLKHGKNKTAYGWSVTPISQENA
jgi:hypothetical protein